MLTLFTVITCSVYANRRGRRQTRSVFVQKYATESSISAKDCQTETVYNETDWAQQIIATDKTQQLCAGIHSQIQYC